MRDLDGLDWPSAGAQLNRIIIDADADADATAAERVLTDDAKTFRRVYGLSGDTVLLVRPDGYIGHITRRNMLKTTQTAASAMTPATLETTE